MPTLVKICGVTQEAQGHEIARLGANFIGINYWPGSKRYLPPDKAAWLADLPASVRIVGVFVNPSLNEIQTAARTGRLDFVQLHGDETPEFCAELAVMGYRVIKAFQVRDESSLAAIARFPVSHVLLDAYHPTERGGSGDTFPWELANVFQRQHPETKLILAGGLTPDNVGTAAAGVRPYAVDVASGVEDRIPGIKNLDKVARFIQQAKADDPPEP